jgi:hypothetical protein
MDKFLLAENPMRPDNKGCFIVHAIPPFTLIRARVGRMEVKSNAPVGNYAFKNIDGVTEDWTLYVVYSEGNAEQCEHIISRAWRWYRSYMEWEDKNIDTDDYAKEN